MCQEIDDAERLSRVEEWQRERAWATWEKIRVGAPREVSRDDLMTDFAAALRAPTAASRARSLR